MRYPLNAIEESFFTFIATDRNGDGVDAATLVSNANRMAAEIEEVKKKNDRLREQCSKVIEDNHALCREVSTLREKYDDYEQ